MESLRAMFPDTPDATLSHALATSNGDVSAAVEQLLPASEQVASDAALARALQLADTGGHGAPTSPSHMRSQNSAPEPSGASGLAEVARPVLDGLAAAGAAAKAAVEYVASEIAAAAAGSPPPGGASRSDAARRAEAERDDSAVVAGGYSSLAQSSGVHLRSNRGSGRSEPRSGFGKED